MKKPKEQKKPKASPKPNVPKPVAEDDQEKPHDFGGLPQRDFKKSLGCG